MSSLLEGFAQGFFKADEQITAQKEAQKDRDLTTARDKANREHDFNVIKARSAARIKEERDKVMRALKISRAAAGAQATESVATTKALAAKISDPRYGLSPKEQETFVRKHSENGAAGVVLQGIIDIEEKRKKPLTGVQIMDFNSYNTDRGPVLAAPEDFDEYEAAEFELAQRSREKPKPVLSIGAGALTDFSNEEIKRAEERADQIVIDLAKEFVADESNSKDERDSVLRALNSEDNPSIRRELNQRFGGLAVASLLEEQQRDPSLAAVFQSPVYGSVVSRIRRVYNNPSITEDQKQRLEERFSWLRDE